MKIQEKQEWESVMYLPRRLIFPVSYCHYSYTPFLRWPSLCHSHFGFRHF